MSDGRGKKKAKKRSEPARTASAGPSGALGSRAHGTEAPLSSGGAPAPALGVPPAAALLDPAPTGPSRDRMLLLLGGFLLLHLAIPLRYYLGSDLYDERFAWRMFSAVRVQECEITVSEVSRGSETELRPMTFLPAPWVGLLERSRPAVVRSFLAWRCAGGGHAPSAGAEPPELPESVAVRSACIDASGDPVPVVVREMTCDGRLYAERTLDGALDEGTADEGTP